MFHQESFPKGSTIVRELKSLFTLYIVVQTTINSILVLLWVFSLYFGDGDKPSQLSVKVISCRSTTARGEEKCF